MDRLPNLCSTWTDARGITWCRYSDGRVLPVVRGGDGTGTGSDAGQGGAGQGATPPPHDPGQGTGQGQGGGQGSPTFSQDDLARRAAAEKEQGRRAGETAVLQVLGVTDAAEAKRIIEAHREAERSQMSDAQRAKADADAAKAEADRARAAATAARRDADVERALLRAGIALPEKEEDVAKVLTRAVRLVDIEGEATADKVAAAVADLKATMPALFSPGSGSGGSGTGNGNLPGGNPAGRGGRPGNGPTGIEAGRARARQEQEEAAKRGNPLDAFNVMGARR